MSDTKVCTKCGVEKALSEFYPGKSYETGYGDTCRACLQAVARAKQPVKPKKPPKTVEEKRAYQRQYYLDNKEAVNKRNTAYYGKNRESVLEKGRVRDAARTPEQIERDAATRRAHYETNKDSASLWGREYYQKNKAKIDAKNKKWTEENPERNCATVQARNARKLAIETEFVDYLLVYVRDKSCYLCGDRLLETQKRHVDHIIPVSRPELSPTHSYENCVGTHALCNQRKFNRTAEEYWMLLNVSWPLTCKDNWVHHETPWYFPTPAQDDR